MGIMHASRPRQVATVTSELPASSAGTLSMELPLLLRLLDECYDKKAWHGPNLKGSIRRVEAGSAAWRPQRERHSIVENVVHCATGNTPSGAGSPAKNAARSG